MAKKQHVLSDMEISLFLNQIHMMLSSGLALYEGIEALAANYRGTPSEPVFSALSREVIRSGLLSEAFESDSGWPKYLIQMTRVGEKTGNLEEIMKILSMHYEREARIKSAVRSAAAYPAVLGIMVFAIVCVMLLMVLPMFRSVLESMGVAITEAGSGMIHVGIFLGWAVLAVVGVLILGSACVFILMKTPLRNRVARFLISALPPVKKIARRMDAARIAAVLSMTFSGGFAMDEGIQMAGGVASDESTPALLESMAKKTAKGVSFPDVMEQTGLYDPVYISMLKTGVHIGKTDSVLSRIAEEYHRRTEEEISSFVSVIEPTLVALLAIVVGAMLLSVMLPMAGVLVGVF